MGTEGESVIGAGGSEEVNVNIRCSNGSEFSVKTSLESTVREFEVLLSQNWDVPAEQQRLIYKGRILKDDQTLASYGLQVDHTVHMVRGFASATSPASAPAASRRAASRPASTGNTSSTPAVMDGGGHTAVASVLPGLCLGALGGTGASGIFGAGIAEFEHMQQQLTQNPNMMREIMNIPAIQSLMNNPEIMHSLIMSNPQMHEVIDRNPEVAHIVSDPGILRQTLEAARNPELMREMMRNTDRAMSNIESSPEGFNMLRRMYENIQEPFLNATSLDGGTAADVRSNPFTALLGNQGSDQTRDESNSTTAGSGITTGTTVPNANPLPNPWSSTGGSQTNNTTSTNLTGNGRVPPTAGLGGLPGMGMEDSSAFSQLLQNPAITQMMRSLLSNPQYMDQILGVNPQLRSMLDVNPQLREMMQNPEILPQLTSPEMMQRMMALQQQLSQLTLQQSTPEGAQTGQARGPQNNMSLELLMNMVGGLGAGSFNVPSTPDVPPDELYATQLVQLQEIGFFDIQENIRALRATSGNVHAAVERLLRNPGQ